MVNSSNGGSALPMVTHKVVEELEIGLVPQAQDQPVVGLFRDQIIFVSAPQYNWRVQGAVGINDEARQHKVALAQRLHQFGHRTKEREIELWHWLSNAIDLPRLERLLNKNQEIWETEYNKFVNELSIFVNKELNKFQRSPVIMGDLIRDFCISTTNVCESTQATSQRMDRVQQQVTSISSDL